MIRTPNKWNIFYQVLQHALGRIFGMIRTVKQLLALSNFHFIKNPSNQSSNFTIHPMYYSIILLLIQFAIPPFHYSSTLLFLHFIIIIPFYYSSNLLLISLSLHTILLYDTLYWFFYSSNLNYYWSSYNTSKLRSMCKKTLFEISKKQKEPQLIYFNLPNLTVLIVIIWIPMKFLTKVRMVLHEYQTHHGVEPIELF